MSYYFRSIGCWPLNDMARFMWQLRYVTEDLQCLSNASTTAPTQDARRTLVRYLLVALHAFDELAKSMQASIRKGGVGELELRDIEAINDAFSTYHRTLE